MKKTKLIALLTVLGILVILIFTLVLIFAKTIESQILNLISIYGYFAIFITAFIIDIIAQPLGPEVAIGAAKLINLNMLFVAIIVSIATTLASIFNYKVGKLLYPFFHKKKKYKKYFNIYQKYGKYGLLIASLGPVPYVPFCWLSGSFTLPKKQFILFGIFPRIIRIIVVSFILYPISISLV